MKIEMHGFDIEIDKFDISFDDDDGALTVHCDPEGFAECRDVLIKHLIDSPDVDFPAIDIAKVEWVTVCDLAAFRVRQKKRNEEYKTASNWAFPVFLGVIFWLALAGLASIIFLVGVWVAGWL